MDNRYFNYECPALMQDGRFITNYLQNRTYEQYIRKVNSIDSAQDYRMFLQQKGDVLIKREKEHLEKTNTCSVQGKCMQIAKNANNAVEESCGCICKPQK